MRKRCAPFLAAVLVSALLFSACGLQGRGEITTVTVNNVSIPVGMEQKDLESKLGTGTENTQVTDDTMTLMDYLDGALTVGYIDGKVAGFFVTSSEAAWYGLHIGDAKETVLAAFPYYREQKENSGMYDVGFNEKGECVDINTLTTLPAYVVGLFFSGDQLVYFALNSHVE